MLNQVSMYVVLVFKMITNDVQLCQHLSKNDRDTEQAFKEK